MEKDKNIDYIMAVAGAETETKKCRVLMFLTDDNKASYFDHKLGREVECYRDSNGVIIDEFGYIHTPDYRVTLNI